MNNININTNYGLISDLPADVQDVTRKHTVYRCFITTGEGNYSFNLATAKSTVFLRVTDIGKLDALYLLTAYGLGHFCGFMDDAEIKAKVERILAKADGGTSV